MLFTAVLYAQMLLERDACLSCVISLACKKLAVLQGPVKDPCRSP